MIKPAILGLLVATATASMACTTECTFKARCDGDLVETCSVAVDQLVGSPISRKPCQAPNPKCVQVEDDVARCVTAEDAVCDKSYIPQCLNNAATTCTTGFVVARDCTVLGPGCVLNGSEAVCAVDPLVACESDSYVTSCQDNTVLRCRRGFVQGEACDAYVPPRKCGQRNGYRWCLE